MLVFGGIHGDEPASVAALVELATRLPFPAAPPLWLLPAVNPDGLARGAKNSARDVDLNRNFPARSFTTAHAPGYFPGPAPLSEPETQVLATLISPGSPRGAVAVHAPFACVNYDGPAAALGRRGRGGLRLAGAVGHRLPDPGLVRQLAGPRSGAPRADDRAPARAPDGFRSPAATALNTALRAAPEG